MVVIVRFWSCFWIVSGLVICGFIDFVFLIGIVGFVALVWILDEIVDLCGFLWVLVLICGLLAF